MNEYISSLAPEKLFIVLTSERYKYEEEAIKQAEIKFEKFGNDYMGLQKSSNQTEVEFKKEIKNRLQANENIEAIKNQLKLRGIDEKTKIVDKVFNEIYALEKIDLAKKKVVSIIIIIVLLVLGILNLIPFSGLRSIIGLIFLGLAMYRLNLLFKKVTNE
ncbi:hypothetical protein Celal_1438 [Cellulophaga algicola DSM 14237]|uniref:Uncharacterized protein n=1 Tax=Cellulophaga algicola (strain DSM 14237 / IC166 / ACAM 630) TaxID=688270 RepID=E6X9K1_CELAD|nr:hypothetical protein [Cellulophaga algicola]ADV48751.1 hypothetical protein Celal_1438 [Cellulophaga algicola DSM 14237]